MISSHNQQPPVIENQYLPIIHSTLSMIFGLELKLGLLFED